MLASATTLLGFVDGDAKEEVRSAIDGSKCVSTFLENSSCSLLQVICTTPAGGDGTPSVELSNKMRGDSGLWDDPDQLYSQVLFVKLRPEAVTERNFARVIMVTSMLDSPIHALYNATHRVYAPMLLRDAAWSDKLDRKMQKLIAVMDSGLGSLVRSGAAQTDDVHDKKALAAILTPADEFKLWNQLCNDRRHGEAARHFSEIFSSISSRFDRMGKEKQVLGVGSGASGGTEDSNRVSGTLSVTLSEVLELVDDTQNTLDDIWKVKFVSPISRISVGTYCCI